jgi:hypothetical protein
MQVTSRQSRTAGATINCPNPHPNNHPHYCPVEKEDHCKKAQSKSFLHMHGCTTAAQPPPHSLPHPQQQQPLNTAQAAIDSSPVLLHLHTAVGICRRHSSSKNSLVTRKAL